VRKPANPTEAASIAQSRNEPERRTLNLSKLTLFGLGFIIERSERNVPVAPLGE
jgi:hypothetical protein